MPPTADERANFIRQFRTLRPKLRADNDRFKLRQMIFPGRPVVVAEGDSWFEYPLEPDFLDWLTLGDSLKSCVYNIFRLSSRGDTVEEMVCADPNDPSTMSRQFRDVLRKIDELKPALFLFSGGGNDLFDHPNDEYDPLFEILEQKGAPYPINRAELKSILDLMLDRFRFMIRHVLGADSKVHIVLHGYDYAFPDGRPAVDLPIIRRIGPGPWVWPSFEKRGYSLESDFEAMRAIVVEIVDAFNEGLDALQAEPASQGRVHYVNLRDTLPNQFADWKDELHPRAEGFQKLAAEMHKVMHNLV